ncbi:MAG TPA: nucleotidyltransferase domain-containing protein [Candidatus Thermoplasmatota archaeon]
MKFTRVPERLLAGRTAIRTLSVLLSHPEREMTGREIAALAKAPPLRVIERLRALELEGLVDRRTVGPAHLWKLDRKHFLVERLSGLFEIDTAAQTELRASIKRWADGLSGVREAWLFGSVARRAEEPDSDVDLLLVVENETVRERLGPRKEAFAEEVRERFGNPLNVIVLTTRERRSRRGRGFVGQAEKEGEPLHKVKDPGDLLYARLQ